MSGRLPVLGLSKISDTSDAFFVYSSVVMTQGANNKFAEPSNISHIRGMNRLTKIYLTIMAFCLTSVLGNASRLDSDPDVVFFDEENAMTLLVVKPSTVFASKKGGRRLGAYPIDTKVKLLGMTDKGYMVKGKAKHSMVTGWVSPQNLASTDPKFVKNLKSYYKREMEIRDLIAHQEVAIGMTVEEVGRSIGKPTKEESRVTKDGRSGTWEFAKGKEKKHYTNTVDPRSGQVYRRFSHVTFEETEKLTVEFENDVVTAISNMKNNGVANVKIIVPPIIFAY